MKKIDIGEAIREELETPEEKQAKLEKRKTAEKSAEAEIRVMTAERIKGGIEDALPQVIEALDEGSFDRAAMDKLAKEVAAKAMLEPQQAEKMPNILAKALLLEARKEGFSPEMKNQIREAAEETLLPPDFIQTRAKECLEGIRSSHEDLRKNFINANVDAIVKETGVRREAAEAKLLKALRELEDEDLMKRAGNGE